MFVTTRPLVFFDAPDDGGSGAPAADAPADAPLPTAYDADVADAAEADSVAAIDAATDEEVGFDDVAPATPDTPDVPDYATWIEERGGQDELERSINLSRALQTREGLQALVDEAGKALYGDDPAKAALLQQLLGQPVAEQAADPLAALLADPDHIITPEELAAVVDAKVAAALAPLQAGQKTLAEQQAAERDAAIERSVQGSIAALKVPEKAAARVLDLANQYVTEADLSNPTKVHDAIRRGLADWESEAAEHAKLYLASKKQAADEHPTPLTSGTAPGGTEPSEPQSMKEAKARVRAAMPEEFKVHG